MKNGLSVQRISAVVLDADITHKPAQHDNLSATCTYFYISFTENRQPPPNRPRGVTEVVTPFTNPVNLPFLANMFDMLICTRRLNRKCYFKNNTRICLSSHAKVNELNYTRFQETHQSTVFNTEAKSSVVFEHVPFTLYNDLVMQFFPRGIIGIF